MSLRLLPWSVALCVVALSLTACSGGPEATSDGAPGAGESSAGTPTPAATVRVIDNPSCLPTDASTVVAGPSDDPVLVSTLGTGDKVVVLAPQQGGDPCQWAEQAERLAGAGYRAVLFTWAGDSTVSIPAAVEVLMATGEPRYALIGASKGGLYVAAMAAELDPAPVGVIAVGPPASIDTLSAGAATEAYTGPLLVIASATDSIVSSESSRTVARAQDPSTFVELPAGGHGVALFTGETGPQVVDLVDTFLAKAFA